MRAFYKDLIALRRGQAGLRGTSVEILHRNDTNKVIVVPGRIVNVVA